MIPKELNNTIVAMHRNHLRALARLKALESLIFERMLPGEREAWTKSYDEQANKVFQHYLELAEDKSPGFAAALDNRSPIELEGIDDPLH
jgi:hypothetical protein